MKNTSAAIQFDEDSPEKYIVNSAKGYTGLQRHQKNSAFGTMYEHTPILFELPAIGKNIIIAERVFIGNKMELRRIGRNRTYKVCSYTEGIDCPLKNNNFMLCSYSTKSGIKMAKSFRTLDISLGIIRIWEVEDEEGINSKQ